MTIAHTLPEESIHERQQRLIDEFLLFDDWAERYQYLIDLGGCLPTLPASMYVDRHRVPKCHGETFLACERRYGRLILHAASDMPVLAGILAIMVRIYGGQAPVDILRQPPVLLDRVGLTHKLSPHRRIALFRIHERLVALASDFDTTGKLAS